MKFSLRIRFIIIFFFLTIAGLGLINTGGNKLIYRQLVNLEKNEMYKETLAISHQYLSSFHDESDASQTNLKTFSELINRRIWVVDNNGLILLDSEQRNKKSERNILKYDSYFLDNQFVVGIRPKGFIGKKTLSCICPITSGLKTTGYLVVLSEVEPIEDQAMDYTNTISVAFLLLMCLFALASLYLYLESVHSVHQITKAAQAYINRDFSAPLPKVRTRDHQELIGTLKYLAENAATMNEAQKNFIANVSHDFRSPLTSIKGYTEALLDGTIPPELNEKYLGIIHGEVERLTKLTSNLLDLNQAEGGDVLLQLEAFDINGLIKHTLEIFEQRCQAKKITIDLIFESKYLYVEADLDKIARVIQNLVDNAIKFSPQDSTIEIHTEARRHKAFISIKDHGIGIDKKEIHKIWGRFYKSDKSRGKDKTGTGLGLAITKEFVEAHGEHINAISTPGAGTEFIFSLPLDDE